MASATTAPPRARAPRLLFAGTPEFAASHLQALLADGRYPIVGVYTQPDRPAGRGKKLAPSPVKTLSLRHELPVHQPEHLKDRQTQAALAALDADLMVVVAYGLLLPQAVLDIPPLGCINVHASLLPCWRGAAPIQRAIQAGDTETGICIMAMEAGLDTGPVLRQVRCSIEPDDTGGSLHNRLATLGGPALLAAIDDLVAGVATPQQLQDGRLATYAAKIAKAEAAIDWRNSAIEIERLVRAFNPTPVAFTTLGGERLRIWAASADMATSRAPAGTLLDASSAGLRVACGSGILDITELQFAGKNRLPVAAALNSRGDDFQPGRILGH
ncbi:MAG: methionyl-tRNA formyltransferase [Porticoccaceae bacterium]